MIKYYDLIYRTLQDSFKDEVAFRKRAEAELQKRRELLTGRLERIYVDRLDGVKNNEMWERKSAEWKSELADIDRNLTANPASPALLLDKGIRIIELAKTLYPSYIEKDSTQKRLMLQILLSNCSLNGSKVHYSYKKPFNYIVKGSNSAGWWG